MSHVLLDEGYLTDAAERNLKLVNSVRSTNAVVANAINAQGGVARNAMGIEEAERKSEQFVAAAKSRIAAEAGTLADTIKLLKQVRGHEDSAKIQDSLMSLQWALEEVKKAASRFK